MGRLQIEIITDKNPFVKPFLGKSLGKSHEQGAEPDEDTADERFGGEGLMEKDEGQNQCKNDA